MKNLTFAQRDELIEQFVEIQLDNMDTQSLYELASEYVTNSFDRLTDSEIKERIESLYDEELYEELGGISAEYFCGEFIFETGDPDDIPRLHDSNYLKINWGLN